MADFSAVVSHCCGCGGDLIRGQVILFVDGKPYHSCECYERTRPAADVWRERCRDVDRLERELAIAKQRRQDAAKRMDEST